MGRIVIEVPEATEKKWEGLSQETKNQLQQRFENQLDIVAKGINDAAFRALLDKSSDEAQKNGLTEEILQEILKDEWWIRGGHEHLGQRFPV